MGGVLGVGRVSCEDSEAGVGCGLGVTGKVSYPYNNCSRLCKPGGDRVGFGLVGTL